jgi:hypothetical protein
MAGIATVLTSFATVIGIGPSGRSFEGPAEAFLGGGRQATRARHSARGSNCQLGPPGRGTGRMGALSEWSPCQPRLAEARQARSSGTNALRGQSRAGDILQEAMKNAESLRNLAAPACQLVRCPLKLAATKQLQHTMKAAILRNAGSTISQRIRRRPQQAGANPREAVVGTLP